MKKAYDLDVLVTYSKCRLYDVVESLPYLRRCDLAEECLSILDDLYLEACSNKQIERYEAIYFALVNGVA